MGKDEKKKSSRICQLQRTDKDRNRQERMGDDLQEEQKYEETGTGKKSVDDKLYVEIRGEDGARKEDRP